MRIKEINLFEGRNDKGIVEREAVIRVSGGYEVHVVPCYESWEQFGACEDVLWHTMPCAERLNRWLHHGKPMPYFEDLGVKKVNVVSL